MKTHQNQYSNYNSDFGSPSPLPSLHFAIFFQSLPSSLSFIMMVWEQKKEKKKLALDINARLKVLVCCNGNDSADF
jgi:hypothetical protein